MSAAAARILRDAAAELESHGWCQGTMYDGKRSCLVGSLARATGVDTARSYFDAFEAVSAHLGQPPAHWNDQPERTQTEVVKELLMVADLEEVR